MKYRTPVTVRHVAELCHELMILGAETALLFESENGAVIGANEVRMREIVAELRALGIKDENIPFLFD